MTKKKNNEDVISQEYREAVKRFMLKRGLNPFSWAKRANMPEGTLRNFINGNTDTITLKSLSRLASALEMSLSDLIWELSANGGPTSLRQKVDETPEVLVDDETGFKIYTQVAECMRQKYGPTLNPEDIVYISRKISEHMKKIGKTFLSASLANYIMELAESEGWKPQSLDQ